MRVYVDMDDVLCETAASLCGMAEREFARRVRYEDVKHFDLQKVFSLDDGEMAAFRALSPRKDAAMRQASRSLHSFFPLSMAASCRAGE